jgi:sialate O-acetylesterase
MPSRSRLTASSGLMLALAWPAAAAPQLDVPFTSHAVLQRGKPVIVTGTADPGERLTLSLAGQSGTATADGQGRWSVQLPPLAVGGPFRLEVRGAQGSSAAAEDLMVGDVWLCSGQSNMEYPLSRALNGPAEVEAAADPMLRLLTIPQRALLTAQPVATDTRWHRSTPESAGEFSAACTFMARELRARNKGVAIGLIDSTWGGTAIRSWMDEAAVRESGGAADADLLALYRRSPPAAVGRYGEQWGAWWRSRSGDAPGSEPWRASDRLKWMPMPAFTYWENWGRPEFETFNGGVWARKRVRLTAEQAQSPATLSLGVIDDSDTTFVNGVAVGTTYSWSAPRDYQLAPGLLKAGDNELLVFVRDNWAFGGFQGPAERVKLAFVGKGEVPLGSGWEISVAPASIGEPPLAPWDGQSGVGTLYNGMIAPLGRLGLAGVAWYQGEADVGKAGYDRRLAALMANWRRQFGDERLPFLIVGLAGWGEMASKPVESGWAALINEQRLAAERDARAALVSAIDLGEQKDIHPPNKQEVGRRLALAALGLVHGHADGRLAPRPLSASREAGGVRVRFSKPLKAMSGAPLALELCGASQGSCRFVSAELQGNDLVLKGALPGDRRVRHAWAEFPLVNLYDADLLPAPVFELAIDQ